MNNRVKVNEDENAWIHKPRLLTGIGYRLILGHYYELPFSPTAYRSVLHVCERMFVEGFAIKHTNGRRRMC